MNLSRIIASSDFTENSLPAVEAAIDLASENSAVLHLVHVLEIPAVIPSPAATAVSMDHLYAAARERLARLIPDHRSVDLEVETVVLAGVPAAALADYAAEMEADMIVVGTHGRKGLKRALLGSTAESLLREAPCQVLVVKPKLRRQATAGEAPQEELTYEVTE